MTHRQFVNDGCRTRPRRSAAIAVESAIVLSVFMLLILGMLDFGMAVLNRDNLEAAACRLARIAIVRGERSEMAAVPWGPQTTTATANDGTEYAQTVAPILALMPADEVHIELRWPDESNAVGNRVVAVLSYDHPSLFAGLLGTSTWELRAVSTMRIQH